LSRGCRRTKLLHFFSCWPGVSRPATGCFQATPGPPATPHFYPTLAPPPKNPRRGFSRLPIGSPFTAEPWPLNKHARFAGLRPQNRVGPERMETLRPRPQWQVWRHEWDGRL
jgi:hypothetical protein